MPLPGNCMSSLSVDCFALDTKKNEIDEDVRLKA